MFYVARKPAWVIDRIAEAKLRLLYRERWVVIGVNAFALATAFVAPPSYEATLLDSHTVPVRSENPPLSHYLNSPSASSPPALEKSVLTSLDQNPPAS